MIVRALGDHTTVASRNRVNREGRAKSHVQVGATRMRARQAGGVCEARVPAGLARVAVMPMTGRPLPMAYGGPNASRTLPGVPLRNPM